MGEIDTRRYESITGDDEPMTLRQRIQAEQAKKEEKELRKWETIEELRRERRRMFLVVPVVFMSLLAVTIFFNMI